MRGFPDKAYYALRFEILKRDKFTCQYCGQHAPNVILHIDHITEVCNGGTDEPDNLITCCAACNIGKEGLRSRIDGKKGRLMFHVARPNPNEPSWSEMVIAEPKLALLLAEAEAIKDDGGPSFCPHWFWFGRQNGKESLRNRLLDLVGPEAGFGFCDDYDPNEEDEGIVSVGDSPDRERLYEVPKVIASHFAYEAACRRVFNALPTHRHCYHTEDSWIQEE